MLERNELSALLDETLARAKREPLADILSHGIGVTSGTSGRPLLVSVRKYFAHSAELTGGPERAICLRSSMSTALSYVAFTELRARAHYAAMLYIDPAALSKDVGALIEDFDPDELCGFPHAVANLAGVLSAEARGRIGSIELAGEGLPAAIATRIRESFPNAAIRMIYTASEISGIGRSCPHLPPNTYHPFPGVTVEVFEPDADGEGELLISKMISFGIAVRQYRIGDFGKRIEGTCACGERDTFEVLGRNGRDYIKLAGALLRRELFDRAAADCADVLDDYRAEASLVHTPRGDRGKITLRVYRAGGPPAGAMERIRDAFGSVFVTPSRRLNEVIESGAFEPIEILESETPFPPEIKVAKIVSRID